ncbi:MAG: hypothetical protein J5715_05485 [Clostridiales bacterium]|nr:hypothetical protein [Clostridiales bacterium]
MRYDFVYDGTLEGLLCVIAFAVARRIKPDSIGARYVLDGPSKPKIRPVYIRTDRDIADNFYRYIGHNAGPDCQQLVYDYFLTASDDVEPVIYNLICSSLREGRGIFEKRDDPGIRSVKRRVRDLYREAGDELQELMSVPVNDVQVAVTEPSGIVIPIIRQAVLEDVFDGDFLLYDRRHALLLMRAGSSVYSINVASDEIYKNNRNEQDPYIIYELFWDRFISSEDRRRISYRKERLVSDGISGLWEIPA